MWTLKRLAIVAGALCLGVGLTFLGIRLVWSDDYQLLGVLLTPVWADTLFGGAYLFPKAMGELGHPLAWVIGITLNAVFLAAITAGVVVLVQRARAHKHPNDSRAT
jgi:hypothetical protein